MATKQRVFSDEAKNCSILTVQRMDDGIVDLGWFNDRKITASEGMNKIRLLDARENTRIDNGVTVPDSRIAAMADYTPPEVLRRRPRNVPVKVDNGYDYWRD